MPIVTGIKVVDASAVVAILFGEPAAETVVAWLRGAQLTAPSLLAYEVTKVCLTKKRCNPERRSDLLTAFGSWAEMGISLAEVDQAGVLAIAEERRPPCEAAETRRPAVYVQTCCAIM